MLVGREGLHVFRCMFCKVVRMKKEIHEIDGGQLCGSKKKETRDAR